MLVAIRELNKQYLPVLDGTVFTAHIANLPGDYAVMRAAYATDVANPRDTVQLMYREHRDLLFCVHYHQDSNTPYNPRVFAMRTAYEEGDVWLSWAAYVKKRAEFASAANPIVSSSREI